MKYVLFDIDGVLLNEDRCFDVSALVLWEWYNNTSFFKITNDKFHYTPTDDEIRNIRNYYYLNDELLAWFKSFGINSNWDMEHAHIVAMLGLLWEQYPLLELPQEPVTYKTVQTWAELLSKQRKLHIPTNEELFTWLKQTIPENISKNNFFDCLQEKIAQILQVPVEKVEFMGLGNSLWKLSAQIYESWYFGTENINFTLPGQIGKKEGFLYHEKPTVDPVAIKKLLRDLKEAGYIICIGTGRSLKETRVPLESFGWWEEFSQDRISNADEAVKAQKVCGGAALDKPHPFTYECAYFGVHFKEQEPLIYKEYVESPEKFKSNEDDIYIVGDSIADVMAAQKMGAHIITTLTGLTGNKIIPSFKTLGVEAIVNNVLEIRDILLKKD